MKSEDSSGRPLAAGEDLRLNGDRDGRNVNNHHRPVYEPGHDTQLERATARTEQAETRTEQAKTRTEQAETRIEQAETRTEQAKTRTEQAETRMEAAETRTEQAIRSSEVRYRRLFEAARDGILILDADTGRINDVNCALTALLGVSHGEMVGKTVGELSPFKGMASNTAMLEQLQKHGHVRYDAVSLETRDGRKLAVEFVSNVYRADSCNVIQCNVRDITERKLAEEQNRLLNLQLEHRVDERTRQLQIVNEELEAFSYSVSHDLRAPLRHVMGFVDLLKKDAGALLSEKSCRHLATISDAAKRMGALIDDLLVFSHIGKTEMQKTAVNLDPLVQEVLLECQPESTKRAIAWNVGPLPVVQGDRALLRMVLVNLISNAVKFTAIRAAAQIEIARAADKDGETVIFICDNGAGFDPQYANKLFGVFQRLHNQEDFEGTGIGLANVRRIVHRHGGRTWAEGVVDGGATFYFSLPKQGVLNAP